MLELFKGKKVKVMVAFAKNAGLRHSSSSKEFVGILTAYDDNSIVLNDNIYISRNYLITISQ